MSNAAPSDPALWKFEGLITKTKFDINFDQSTQANTAWVTVSWFNDRGQTGVGCTPMSIHLPASQVMPQINVLKIAA